MLAVAQRAQANEDIDEAIGRYLATASAEVALGFVDALQATYALLADHPHIGSPRYAHELGIPGLRHRKLRHYPWLVIYLPQPDCVEVVRVLDARCDIPQTLLSDAD